ncbi:MAG: 2-phospho-L-lactate guanylyltransferase [Phototrophicales bacterium]|nr:MAG: 2-phospho-L-lactate guanylyltransferase [Phototrophicales bacterium]
MKTWIIMPVKPLLRAKSRLSDVLTPEQREKLAISLLVRNLQLLKDLPQVAGILVVSRDTKVLAIARDHDVTTVQESGQPELNTALLRATEFLKTLHAQSVLILPTDLPLLTVEDIQKIIELGDYAGTVVIAPDRQRDGTNALLVNPPGALTYHYGPASFVHHCDAAQLEGLTLKIYESPSIAIDIDTPEDLLIYREMARQYNMPIIDVLAEEVTE